MKTSSEITDCENGEIQAHMWILGRIGVFPYKGHQGSYEFQLKISQLGGADWNWILIHELIDEGEGGLLVPISEWYRFCFSQSDLGFEINDMIEDELM